MAGMEFVRSSDDCYAGYLQDDSDLEFSECSDDVSSEEGEGELVRSKRQCRVPAARDAGSAEWNEDEFEREMECELMGLMKKVASPDALVAAAASRDRGRERAVKGRKKAPSVLRQAIRNPPLSLPSSSQARDEHVSGEEGEREMDKEKGGGGGGSGGGGGGGGEGQIDAAAAYYDKVYFESSSSGEDGEEEEGDQASNKKKKKKKKEEERESSERSQEHRRLTNEELFYDPHMDEEDEQWVKRQRMAYHNVQVSQQLQEEQRQRGTPTHPARAGGGDTGGRGGREGGEGEGGGEKGDLLTPLGKSDAHLSCPACMTTVCIDCQQHAIYSNQFRAMFVMNCRIQRDEVLKHIPKLSKKERQRRRRRKERRHGGEGEGGEGERREEEEEGEDYNPVHCAECNTEIAVYDKDEVFHFFNVLASAS